MLLHNYGCWPDTYHHSLKTASGDLRLKCKACKVSLLITPLQQEQCFLATLVGNNGKLHNWCNKTHLKQYNEGF